MWGPPWAFHGGCWFFPFGFFLLIILMGLGLAKMLRFRHFGHHCGRPFEHSDYEGILKNRLANGEITEEDYQRLKELLRH